MTTGQQQRAVGRGGAGNFTEAESPKVTSADLVTPTIRSETYTTGRGGAGNMQHSDAAKARLAQDITPTPRRESGSTPIGRGGAGNIVRSKDAAVPEHAIADGSPRNSGEHSRARGMLDKVKEKLGHEKKGGSPPAA